MKSSDLFFEAKELMPGGVSSPVRAIAPFPFYTVSAKGSRLFTADGDTFLDCCMAYGPLILGHAHPEVRRAIEARLQDGWLYGTPTPVEIEMAKLIASDHRSVDMVRFVSSGSEATMAAIRLARGATGKQEIVKIEGGFHGAHDGVLVKAGSGATTLGIPDSAGVPPAVAELTRQVPFNDAEALDLMLARNDGIAALIVEPVMGNIGPILPDHGYLKDVRSITEDYNVILIFDEVITGYRVGIGGAQAYYGVRPDLSTFGKIIGGGLPIGAFAGRRDLMSLVAPQGPVYQAGTFSGNPLSLAAGHATLRWIHDNPEIYASMASGTKQIQEALGDRADSFVRLGSMFKYYFRDSPPRNYREAKESDIPAFRAFWNKMKKTGIFLPPSQFETNFLSTAHSTDDIAAIAEAYVRCLS